MIRRKACLLTFGLVFLGAFATAHAAVSIETLVSSSTVCMVKGPTPLPVGFLLSLQNKADTAPSATLTYVVATSTGRQTFTVTPGTALGLVATPWTDLGGGCVIQATAFGGTATAIVTIESVPFFTQPLP
jgi:hypothetical protein